MSLGTIFTHQGWNVKLFLAPVVGHVPERERANKLIRHTCLLLSNHIDEFSSLFFTSSFQSTFSYFNYRTNNRGLITKKVNTLSSYHFA